MARLDAALADVDGDDLTHLDEGGGGGGEVERETLVV